MHAKVSVLFHTFLLYVSVTLNQVEINIYKYYGIQHL